MTPSLFVMQLFTGIALGSIYVLLAVGLSLIFGLLTVVNFAHGALFALGAYVGIFVFGLTDNFWLALVAVPIIVGCVGLVIERVLVRRLYGRGIDYPLLLTFGLTYVLLDIIRILWGKQGLPFDAPDALSGAVNLWVGYFPLYRLFLVGMTVILLGALWLFIEKTNYGLVIRAGARDPEIVRVLGIDIARIWLVVFGIGAGMAGMAGMLAAPLQGVFPEMGTPVLMVAFVVTVVGGMGSLAGAVVAGLAVGIAESFTAILAPQFSQITMYVLMVLVLLLRPQGLFGRAGLLS